MGELLKKTNNVVSNFLVTLAEFGKGASYAINR